MNNNMSNKVKVLQVGLFLLAIPCVAQTQESQNPISGIVSAADGAFHQFQDELSKRPAEVQPYNVTDYRAWLEKFSETLDQATPEYVSRLDQEIVPKLKPLSDRYRDVMNQKILENQKQLIAAPVAEELQTLANSLAPQYRAIYKEFFAKVFPWAPYIDFRLTKELAPGKIAASFTDIVDGGSSHFFNPEVAFQISRMDGEGGIVKEGHFTKSDWSGKYGKDGSSMSPEFIYDTIEKKLTKKDLVPYFVANFLAPEVYRGCESQTCLGLKLADISEALGKITTTLDVPFALVSGGSIPKPEILVGNDFTTPKAVENAKLEIDTPPPSSATVNK